MRHCPFVVGFEEGAAALAAARLMHSSWEGARESQKTGEGREGWACSCLASEPAQSPSARDGALEQVASLRASVPILPPPCQSGQLLAAEQCSGSQWQEQEQLEQALASLPRMLLQMFPCALTPLRGLGFRSLGAWTVPVPLRVHISLCWQRVGSVLP